LDMWNRSMLDKWHKFNLLNWSYVFRILECHEFLRKKKEKWVFFHLNRLKLKNEK
jgi:hypothetical protein